MLETTKRLMDGEFTQEGLNKFYELCELYGEYEEDFILDFTEGYFPEEDAQENYKLKNGNYLIWM